VTDADIDRLAFAPEANRAAQATAFPDHRLPLLIDTSGHFSRKMEPFFG
jgi:hypothetical protein